MLYSQTNKNLPLQEPKKFDSLSIMMPPMTTETIIKMGCLELRNVEEQ